MSVVIDCGSPMPSRPMTKTGHGGEQQHGEELEADPAVLASASPAPSTTPAAGRGAGAGWDRAGTSSGRDGGCTGHGHRRTSVAGRPQPDDLGDLLEQERRARDEHRGEAGGLATARAPRAILSTGPIRATSSTRAGGHLGDGLVLAAGEVQVLDVVAPRRRSPGG